MLFGLLHQAEVSVLLARSDSINGYIIQTFIDGY